MDTQKDNFEFAVSQAVDGVLSDMDRHVLGERLRSVEARVLAEDHEQINALLREHAARPAGVDYDSFADAFSATLAAEDAYAPAAIPIRSTWTRRLAIAAALILTALAAWPFLPHGNSNPGPAGGQLVVEVPAVEQATQPVKPMEVAVSVGPSEALVSRGMQAGLTPAAHSPQAARVVISSVVEPPTDASRPY
ncbi:MAG: hypothetical protein QM754_14090 [Tepidisphaeraceae bacterium]